MGFSVLSSALALLLLTACTSVGFEAPRIDKGLTAPEEYRLDLDDGVVVTFDDGPSPDDQGKVAYVTHVSSGSQMVIGREGQVISRHDGRGGGPTRLTAILADKAIMGRIIAGANAEDLPFPQHADWVNFVKFEGITYIANRGRAKAGVDDLGEERYRIAFKLQHFAGFGYRSQDGDAAFLDPGTPIFELKRFGPKFRLAAVVKGEVRMFEADTNPAARTGADLLDIRNRVRSIGINSSEDGRTELASIDNLETVGRLVEIVLSAPVDQTHRDRESQLYFIAFHLDDGTSVRRAYRLESGELSRGIMTDSTFRHSVTQALVDALKPAPTPTSTLATKFPDTPRLDQGLSTLLESMEKFPASLKEQGVWFADYHRALELAGVPQPHTLEEYGALSQVERDAYDAARRGLVRGRGLVQVLREFGPQWEEVFGFGLFDVDLSVGFGSHSARPLPMAYLEGDFRKDAMRERLLNLGYQERTAGESIYYAIRGDYEAGLQDPGRSRAMFMNRVFVEDGSLFAAPETDRMVKVLDHSTGKTPTLADDVMFSSLAASLGDPLSAALLTRSAALRLRGSPDTVYEKLESWGALHHWEAVGAGYVIANGSTWWGLSLFYSGSQAAGSDADELVRRMTEHQTTLSIFYQEPSGGPSSQQPKQPFEEFCVSLAPSVRSEESGSTLTVWCKVGDNPIGNQWWSVFLDMRDLEFVMP